jgi:phage baseplate assembly protein W
MATRTDYAFPFRIDSASLQGAQSAYDAHVEQMLRELLLTGPGERVCLPEFGCGLRQLLFAPISSALTATTKLLVQDSINRWLGGIVSLKKVSVDADGPEGQLVVNIEYVVVETLTGHEMRVTIV